jgi:putative DNA primase/helicase
MMNEKSDDKKPRVPRIHASDIEAWLYQSGYSFAKDPGGELFVYQKGVYRPCQRHFISGLVKRFCNESKRTKSWTSRLSMETYEYLRADAKLMWSDTTDLGINCRNGILRLSNLELQPHSPFFLSSIQLPVIYDPSASGSVWEDFFSTVLPDSPGIGPEIVAFSMLPEYSIQKMICLTGEGSNGKSTFLTALGRFLGEENISSAPEMYARR